MILTNDLFDEYALSEPMKWTLIDALKWYHEELLLRANKTRNTGFKKDYLARAMHCTLLANAVDPKEDDADDVREL